MPRPKHMRLFTYCSILSLVVHASWIALALAETPSPSPLPTQPSQQSSSTSTSPSHSSTVESQTKSSSTASITISTKLSIDLCTNFSNVTVEAAVMRSAAPRVALEPNAGAILSNSSSRSIQDCAASCCALPTCHLAYQNHLTCYHVACDTTATEACDAVTLMDAHVVYSMVRVRDVHPAAPLHTKSSESTPASTSSSNNSTTVTNATTSSTTSTKPKEINKVVPETTRLTVSVGNNKTLVLPNNEMLLSAYVVPKPSPESEYKYQWTLLTSPEGAETGAMDGISSSQLSLKKLIAGKYVFQVKVTGKNSLGDAIVAVDVLPPQRKNQPPVAKISPPFQEVQLPNNLVLDGSTSTDDDKIVTYHWEEVSGPLTGQAKLDDKAILQMTNLAPGAYVFKLTVTDSDGASGSATAHVNVLKERDYPPVAKPGQNVILYLPTNKVTLYGNASTDDHEIVSYEWIKESSDNLAADMQGARSSILNVSNMEIGVYTFTLKVTDSIGQVNSASVKVFVKARQNIAPKADAGVATSVSMPIQQVILYGNASTDDESIVRYLWSQVSGPYVLTPTNGVDKVLLILSNLHLGHYVFNLTVWDKEGLNSTATTTLDIMESSNQKPRAEAGPDVDITLPDNFIALDGSKSWDDKEIVHFIWERTEDSPAAGDVLNHSSSKPVLLMGNLIAGIYTFKLTVVDAEDAKSTDTVKLTVNENPSASSLVELHLVADIKTFTEENKNTVASQLGFLVKKYITGGSIEVHIQSVKEHLSDGNVILTLYGVKKSPTSPSTSLVNGKLLEKLLRQKIGPQKDVIDYPMVRVETAVCQNNCSNHGRCDQRTKVCICDPYWITNHLRIVYGDGQSNCDWSLVYVIIVVFLVAILFSLCVWLIICCSRRNTRLRRVRSGNLASNKKHKYTLLNGYEEMGGVKYADRSNKSNNGNITRQPLLPSDSETDSDEEETIFINRKLQGETTSTSLAHRKGTSNNGTASILET